MPWGCVFSSMLKTYFNNETDTATVQKLLLALAAACMHRLKRVIVITESFCKPMPSAWSLSEVAQSVFSSQEVH